MKTIDELRNWRISLRITQRMVAKAIFVSRGTLHRWEAHKGRVFPDFLINYEKFLNGCADGSINYTPAKHIGFYFPRILDRVKEDKQQLVRETRISLGITLAELGDVLGLTPGGLFCKEKGIRPMRECEFDTAMTFLNALKGVRKKHD